MVFGYARVSKQEQSLERQIDILMDHGIHKANIYKEKVTGITKDRPQLEKLLTELTTDDVLVLTELTRLGRSTKDLITISEKLKDIGVELVSLKENIDTTTATGKAMFGMLSVMAQFERDLISERTKEGLRSARARGRVGGRPRVPKKDVEHALILYDAGDLCINDICNLVGISKPTLYKYVNKRNKSRDDKRY